MQPTTTPHKIYKFTKKCPIQTKIPTLVKVRIPIICMVSQAPAVEVDGKALLPLLLMQHPKILLERRGKQSWSDRSSYLLRIGISTIEHASKVQANTKDYKRQSA